MSDGATTRFGYDGGEIVLETDGANAVLRRYVKGAGADETLVWYEGSGTSSPRWLYADERGSVVAITDGAGSPLATNTYDEYGRPDSGNLGRFQYTGQAYIASLGLYYYKARFYAPSLGKFLQPDPIGYAGGMNLYAYVGGDPVNFTDPTGLVANTRDNAGIKPQDLAAAGEDLIVLGCARCGVRWATISGIRYNILTTWDGNEYLLDASGKFGLATMEDDGPGEFVVRAIRAPRPLPFGMTFGGTAHSLVLAYYGASDAILIDPIRSFGQAVEEGDWAAAAFELAMMLPFAKVIGAARATRALPALDRTGKVHGALPRAEDLSRYSHDELRQLQQDLRQSVQERIRKTSELGPDRAHGQRQGAEQQLIIQIEKFLSGP